MARTFIKTAGNYISLPAATLGGLISGAGKISIHAWSKYTSFSATNGANDDRTVQIQIAGASTTGLTICVDGSGGPGTQKTRIGARSASGDALQVKTGTTVLSTGQWYSHGGTVDFGGKFVTPYLNGAADNTALSATFANATYTPNSPSGVDEISSSANGTNAQIDGAIAEVAIWTDDIGAAGFLALSKGMSAKLIRPEKLVFYLPIWGIASPEVELRGGKVPTINGTVTASVHPRILYPQGIQNIVKASGGGGGSNFTQAINFSTTTSFARPVLVIGKLAAVGTTTTSFGRPVLSIGKLAAIGTTTTSFGKPTDRVGKIIAFGTSTTSFAVSAQLNGATAYTKGFSFSTTTSVRFSMHFGYNQSTSTRPTYASGTVAHPSYSHSSTATSFTSGTTPGTSWTTVSHPSTRWT